MSIEFGNLDRSNEPGAFAVRVVLTEGPLDLAWHHAGTTAEFLGDMVAVRAAKAGLDYSDARHSINYMVNELMENTIKFRAPGTIDLLCSLGGSECELTVENRIGPEAATKFQEILAELTSRDPGDLMIERIEANAADENSTASGLGILTLMNDYGARMGWRFSDAPADRQVVLRTQASLTLN